MNIKTDFKSLACKAARILLAAAILLATQTAEAASPTVTMKETGKTVETLIQKLRKEQPDYNFLFNNEELKNRGIKSISLEKASLADALKTILEGTGLTYEIDGEIVVIKPAKGVKKEPVTVTGVVKDAQGEPLTGVGVTIMNTNQGCATDYDGRFTLKVPDEYAVLRFSMIGMEPQELMVGKRKSFNITMKENRNMMDEVVVTGYQTLSSERSAGSFETIKGDVIGDKIALTGNIAQSLEGLAPGLNVNMSAGADKFTVRGITSINSTRSPLFVVDGMPLESNQVETLLNGNDIQSVTLLKDATAASIWGSQAANGVIVITTKKGEKGRMKVTYNGSFTYTGKPDYDYMNLMDSGSFLRNAEEMFDSYSQIYDYNSVTTTIAGLSNAYNPIILPHERILYMAKAGEISSDEKLRALNALSGRNGRKDYEKYFVSDKWMTRHSVSLNGATDRASYYMSVGYVGMQGTEKDYDNKFSINSNEEFKLTDWLKWDITLNASYEQNNGHLSPWSDYANDMLMSSHTNYTEIPYATFRNEDGTMADWSEYAISREKRSEIETLSGIDMGFYPVSEFKMSELKTRSTNIRVNTGLNFTLYKGLNFQTRFQYSSFNNKTEKYYPQEMWKIREEILASTPKNTLKPALPTTGGNFILDNSTITDWTFRNQVTYNESFSDNLHQVSVLAGTEVREFKDTGYNNFMRGYDIQTMQYTPYDTYNLNRVSNALMGSSTNAFNKTYYTQSEIMRRYFSLYGNLAYTYMQRYTLNASIRVDQSNLFGSNPDNQYKPLWSVGGAWKISDETFLREYTWLNRLTVRATYGFSGNSPKPGQGGSYDILRATSSSFYETPGFAIETPANDRITWEKTRTWNVGFDANIFSNRLNLSFDYYDKKTTDLISPMLLNPASGWVSTIGNIGDMYNRGVEISLDSRNVTSLDFKWNTTLTFSYNSNKITHLDVATPYTANTMATTSGINMEGYPINSLFSYRYAGLNDKGEPMAYKADGTIVSGVDSRGLSKEDVVYSGTIIPKISGGLTNQFIYRNLELSFMFVYNFGSKMRKQVEILDYGRPSGNLLKDFDNRWRTPGDENHTDIPAWTASKNSTANYNLFYLGDNNILDGAFIKLRDLSLSYNFPAEICKAISLSGLKASAKAGNLFYWAANNEHIDPEYYSPATYRNSRQTKFGPTYSFELTVNF